MKKHPEFEFTVRDSKTHTTSFLPQIYNSSLLVSYLTNLERKGVHLVVVFSKNKFRSFIGIFKERNHLVSKPAYSVHTQRPAEYQ